MSSYLFFTSHIRGLFGLVHYLLSNQNVLSFQRGSEQWRFPKEIPVALLSLCFNLCFQTCMHIVSLDLHYHFPNLSLGRSLNILRAFSFFVMIFFISFCSCSPFFSLKGKDTKDKVLATLPVCLCACVYVCMCVCAYACACVKPSANNIYVLYLRCEGGGQILTSLSSFTTNY
ncbi:hypothetical protein BDF20DRAFT_663919 [Mycotypha africana]|uniref:uncharacterized protein n=1 Tax=Mycotypha africana TaxID=64632 RepID=UPI0022FFE93E|nr:uncharacterized protein BDF20DRAFT_663919 [Mycotypha africana]KAI8973649.1 hypothetical protein BDF20DRAFT_663919 [Mycotypha africana]